MNDDIRQPTTSAVSDSTANLSLESLSRQGEYILFFLGLLLILLGWSTGSGAMSNQHLAIARGLTALGLLTAGGLSLVASAIAHHRA